VVRSFRVGSKGNKGGKERFAGGGNEGGLGVRIWGKWQVNKGRNGGWRGIGSAKK